MPQHGQSNEWVAQFAEPLELTQPETVTVVMHQYHGSGNHILGRFRIGTTSASDAAADPFQSLPAEIKELIQVSSADDLKHFAERLGKKGEENTSRHLAKESLRQKTVV